MSEYFGSDELSPEELRRILRSLPRAGAPDDFESKLLDRIAETRRQHIASRPIAVLHDGERGRRFAGIASALAAALIVAAGSVELSLGPTYERAPDLASATFQSAHSPQGSATASTPSVDAAVPAPLAVAAAPAAPSSVPVRAVRSARRIAPPFIGAMLNPAIDVAVPQSLQGLTESLSESLHPDSVARITGVETVRPDTPQGAPGFDTTRSR